MRLLSLSARNFRSFGTLDLDLNVDGLIAVVGANGAGKTTLFDAIEWGLYGGGRGRSGLPARRDGAPEDEDAWVAVEFEIGGRAYRVQRVDGRDATLTDLAAADGEPLARGREETSRQVALLLGLTRDMFRGTFYARQREVQALEADSDKRRAQVELLLGIERLRRGAAYARVEAREQQLVVESLEAEAPDVPALKAQAAEIERAAQAAAPVVQAAQDALAAARARRDAARAALDALRAAEREGAARRGLAEAARAKAEQEAAAFEAVAAQAAAAEAAIAQVRELAPVAARADALAASERAMDALRAEHERAEALAVARREALERAAAAADRIAALADPVASLQDARARAGEVDEELDALDGTLDEVARTRALAEQRVGALRTVIARGERAAAIDEQLAALADAEAVAEAAADTSHAARARREALAEAIRHDEEHRDAVLAGEREAACPTCRRPFAEDERDAVLARYEADLAEARARLATLDAERLTADALAGEARRRAQQARTHAADRRALGDDLPEVDVLASHRAEVKAIEAQVKELVFHQDQARERRASLQAERTALRAGIARLEAAAGQVAALGATRAAAEDEAQRLGEQHAAAVAASDGFSPTALEALRAELAGALDARHRSAALRDTADGAPLLRRRRDAQQQARAEAEAEHARLRSAADAGAVSPDALGAAEAERTGAEAAVDAATEALIEANRVASADSEAVAAARRRLDDARRATARLRDERRELRVRQEVADALSAYREEASRAARPTLEHETALLLGQTTRGMYGAVALTDDYHLEILANGGFHPLRRFSGGEQDLAGLCLRLALSRTLARQRGTETGFILLDEVLGSQDLDRRAALLEQLHTITDSEFRQVLVISHTDDVVQHCDLTIDVARGADGLSVASGPRR